MSRVLGRIYTPAKQQADLATEMSAEKIDLEELSPALLPQQDHVTEEENGEADKPEVELWKQKAKSDYNIIKVLLQPAPIANKGLSFPIEHKDRKAFLENPQGWIRNYKEHAMKFDEDEHYLNYVEGILEMVIDSSPCSDDKNDICPPFLLLQKTVTVDALNERRDPMRTALKLQYQLRHYAGIENNKNSIYDRKIEGLGKIPKAFALKLMDACITPSEVIELMRIDTEEYAVSNTMFEDVLKSQNKELVASKFYQKIVWRTFWHSDRIMDKNDSKRAMISYALKRFCKFIFWNLCYLPIVIFDRCIAEVASRKKWKEQFFSPFSYYLADLVNYSILAILNLGVILTTTPDSRPTHDLVQKHNDTLNRATILGDLPRYLQDLGFRFNEDRQVQVQLPTPTIPLPEWILWACILSRVITEFYQAYKKKGKTKTQKLKNYFSSVSNVCDLILMFFLVAAMVCKLLTIIRSTRRGIYRSIEGYRGGHVHPGPPGRASMGVSSGGEGEALVPVLLVYTIYFYSAGAVITLVHLLHTSTIHIPGMGPMIIAIQRMFQDIGRVIFLFIFFITGFLAPLHGMVACYRNAYDVTGNGEFKEYSSLYKSFITLLWGMFGGLSFSERNSLYVTRDTQTTVFMTAMLVAYAIIMGLMCMNILIAMMCNTWVLVTADKSRDWRFAQFESIMEYNATTNTGNGMPFLFPLCIPYIIYSMVTRPCRKYRARVAGKTPTDNEFAKFLCRNRLAGKKASQS